MLSRSRKNSIAVLFLASSFLLPALPAEAGYFGPHLYPTSQDWQEVWEQFLSWFDFREETGEPGNPDQQLSHATGQNDAGPAIDPNGGKPGPVGGG